MNTVNRIKSYITENGKFDISPYIFPMKDYWSLYSEKSPFEAKHTIIVDKRFLLANNHYNKLLAIANEETGKIAIKGTKEKHIIRIMWKDCKDTEHITKCAIGQRKAMYQAN